MRNKRFLMMLMAMLLPVVVIVSGCGGGGGGDDDDDEDEVSHLVTFTANDYTSTSDCLACHADEGNDLLSTGHWNWQGVSENIEGYETGVHGKTDLINNFCIAIPSNEGRCTQCHIGIGWRDGTFDFTNAAGLDCLICHDTTGTYQKAPTTAGAPDPTVDLTEVAKHVGTPTRTNCGKCHFFAGGGDNVKHPDLPSTMGNPTKVDDVHMGTDGQDFSCQECHTSHDHGIAGMSLHSVDEGTMKTCTDCHDAASEHSNTQLNVHLARVACQTCHIPAFARSLPTKMEWYWEEAGQDIDPIPVDQYGKDLYNKKKGRFVWGKDVRPELKWFSGEWDRVIIGQNDQYTALPAVLAEPVGSKDDVNSMIYPFKMMTGNQPADANNNTLLVPHLFGTGPGPNPYWAKYDWDLALAEGAAYAGQSYTGAYNFVPTVMYLSVNHEIAPKEMALGNSCSDCHFGGIDFGALGYSGDPISGGK